MKGLVHIYCGDGKGKTTAAIGLTLRCIGGGGRVLFTSFLKDNKSGEMKILESLGNVTIFENPKEIKFYKNMNDIEKKEIFELYSDRIRILEEIIKSDKFDMIVMDEVIHVLNYNIISEEEFIGILKNKAENVEVVLTGRNPSDKLLEIADYVTEMEKIKHPFDKGITARKYIEM